MTAKMALTKVNHCVLVVKGAATLKSTGATGLTTGLMISTGYVLIRLEHLEQV